MKKQTPVDLHLSFSLLLRIAILIISVYPVIFMSCTQTQPLSPDGSTPEQKVIADTKQPPEPKPKEGSFTAMTYNVHGLPSGITKDDTNGRLEQIGPLLKPYDIVGLQEVFTDDGYEKLKKSLSFKTHIRYAEKLEGRFMGSGLLFLSKLRSSTEKHTLFGHCNGKLDGASDCLASKGFQMVRVLLADGIEVDVYDSHFEAGKGDKDKEARRKNLLELRKSMKEWSKDRAIIFLGDTNLHEERPIDKKSLDDWLQDIQLKDSCEMVNCPKKGRIDRILFRSSGSLTLTPKTWSIPKGFIDKKGTNLSDHEPIVVTFHWKEKT